MKQVILILFLATTYLSYSQQQEDLVDIRNFQNSLVISGTKAYEIAIHYDSFGKKTNYIGKENSNTYLFQGQEIETNLGIYLFPLRLYSSSRKCFFQPDPESQYTSPYLFVGSDPINFTDLNGAEGKPIIFYGEETGNDIPGISRPWGIQTLEDMGVDAYYLPTESLFNGSKLPEMPEWNGNVFIHGHCNELGHYTVEAKENTNPIEFKFKGDLKTAHLSIHNNGEKTHLIAEPEHMANRLVDVSEELKIPLKNVTIDGCQSTVVASRMTRQMKRRMPTYKKTEFKEMPPEKIQIKGLQLGRYATWNGLLEDETTGKIPIEKVLSHHVTPFRADIIQEEDENGEFTTRRYVDDIFGDRYYGIQGTHEFNNYANGRVADQFEEFYDTRFVPY